MSSQTEIQQIMGDNQESQSGHDHKQLELLFPYDILIRIFLLLTKGDLLSCSLACKQYREASFHSSIWAQILQDQWDRGRRCIAGFDTPLDEIRKDIIRALSAERNWCSQRPKFKSVQRLDLFQRHISKDHSFLTWQSNFISRRLYLPLENETLEYDIVDHQITSSLPFAPDIKLGGFCFLRNGNVHVFKAVRSEIPPNANVETHNPESSVITTLSIQQLLPTTSQNRAGPQRALNTVEKCAFELSLDYRQLPTPFIRILDSRMLLCAFPHDSRLQLLIVFDLDAHCPSSVQLGSPTVVPSPLFDIPISSAHISRNSDAEDLLILFQAALLGGFRLKYSTKYLREVQRAGSIQPSPMNFHVFNQRTDVKWNNNHNTSEKDLNGAALDRVFTFTNDYHCGSCGLASLMIDPANKIESTFRFYKQTSNECPAHRRWHILHSYTSNNEPLRHSAINLISLISPRLQAGEHAEPISCLSINHVGWIEARESLSGSSNAARLVFMLVTLPEPLNEPLPMTIRELDIPNDVLQRATHAWMNSAMGTITIVTHNNRLNVYSY
ncbi:hypothetical protein SCHPADRAFT_495143 [Schizopora paradoxa]|uniref:F-box domain-containing protein n=1 Tax=Schizopora paradoxa TaxID=27342 RepID=A0A0H2S1R8_9AGAM|nr:hypothetical protein SCHPADRAFT_495143 [Schizopora paradoxa]